MERFPRKISRIEPLNLVGTARCAVRAAFSGATMPPAASRAGTSQRDVPTKVRFMGSLHDSRIAHRDHERWGETPSNPDLPWTEIRARRSPPHRVHGEGVVAGPSG